MKEIENLKKIELHLHLDGSFSLQLAKILSGRKEDDLKNQMVVTNDCQNLSEYLEKFDFPIQLMQTKKNLELVAFDLVNQLEKDNVIYAEIRFAPSFHVKRGLTYEEVVQAVLNGLNQNKKVKTNLILCLMRGNSREENTKTLEVASTFYKKGVCALDLAGDEGQYPLDNFYEFFQMAHERNIPFTIHAGEVFLNDEIGKALKLGAKRIGHGISCINDLELMKILKDNRVLLEVCPTSNINTKAVLDYSKHPIYSLYKHRLLISINTDNRTVSDINLNLEYQKLKENFDFTLDDFKNINLVALEYAFLDELEKNELRLKLKDNYESNY